MKKQPATEDTTPCSEVVSRLVRVESKLTKLMQHVGMNTDGRQPIRPSKKSLTDKEKSK